MKKAISFLRKDKEKDKQQSHEVSGPMQVQHEGHLGFSKGGEMKISNLPPEWQPLIIALNTQLNAMGASGITEEEFKFVAASLATTNLTTSNPSSSSEYQVVEAQPEVTSEQNQASQGQSKSRGRKKTLNDYLTRIQKSSANPAPSPAKEVSLSGPMGVKKANLTPEQQLALTEMKMQRLESLQQQLQEEIAALKQTNEQMEESNNALQEQLNRLTEENQKVSNQLTEQKKTFDTQKKQLESEIQYAQRKANQGSEQTQKKLNEEQKLRSNAERTVKQLQSEVQMLKEQVKTAMNSDVKEAQIRFDKALETQKKELNDTMQQLAAELEAERNLRMKLEKEKELVDYEFNNLKKQHEETQSAANEAIEAKKQSFKDMQTTKGQYLLEIKNLKAKLKSEQQEKDKLRTDYETLVSQMNSGAFGGKQAAPAPVQHTPAPQPVVAPSAPAPAPAPSSSAPPPPPTASKPPVPTTTQSSGPAPPPPPPPTVSSSSSEGSGLLGALNSVKLKKVDASEEKEPMKAPQGNDQQSMASMLAFALIARRNDLQGKSMDEGESDEEDENAGSPDDWN
mmetsp:Transcript_27452/g.38724  ORF Transcript_27452/g.38724 Transcript_27452/m.38724 type:complete len:567 (+) Transcript_27452:100-1800(+)